MRNFRSKCNPVQNHLSPIFEPVFAVFNLVWEWPFPGEVHVRTLGKPRRGYRWLATFRQGDRHARTSVSEIMRLDGREELVYGHLRIRYASSRVCIGPASSTVPALVESLLSAGS